MRSERFRRHINQGKIGPIGGKDAPWKITGRHNDEGYFLSLYHYGTHMLTWWKDDAGKNHMLYVSIGIGSVTDQQMMNAAFEELKLPYYFRGRGSNARIEDVNPTS